MLMLMLMLVISRPMILLSPDKPLSGNTLLLPAKGSVPHEKFTPLLALVSVQVQQTRASLSLAPGPSHADVEGPVGCWCCRVRIRRRKVLG